MQKVIAITLLLFFGVMLKSQDASLTIRISDIRSDEGEILVAIFNSDKTFMDVDTRFRELVIQPKKGEVEKTIMLPSDTYALAVLHDLDGDKKMTISFFGVPQEGYGYSNNPGKRLTDPSFERCEFFVDIDSTIIEIDLVYW